MIPASQLTMDTSMGQMFGDDMPDEIKDYQDLIDEFGEQEPVVIVVDISDSDDDESAKQFLADLADELNHNDDFKDVRFKQDIDFAGEKTILYLPNDSINYIIGNDSIEVVEGRYNAVMNAMNEPQYFVSENGKIYLLNMIVPPMMVIIPQYLILAKILGLPQQDTGTGTHPSSPPQR